jgi:hypothetical protein
MDLYVGSLSSQGLSVTGNIYELFSRQVKLGWQGRAAETITAWSFIGKTVRRSNGRAPDGGLAMFTRALDLDARLKDQPR